MDPLEISVKTNNEEKNTIFMMTEERKNGKNVLFISLLTHKGYLLRLFSLPEKGEWGWNHDILT